MFTHGIYLIDGEVVPVQIKNEAVLNDWAEEFARADNGMAAACASGVQQLSEEEQAKLLTEFGMNP